MIEKKHVDGVNKGDVLIYTLSTCIWCKKIKAWLKDKGIAYDYIDVDMLNEADQEIAEKEIKKWNPPCSFPTMVINNKTCIVGYDEKAMKKELGK